MRTVLQSKVRHASELKRKLGITVWREMSDDVSQSLKTVKESNVLVLSISFLILGLHYGKSHVLIYIVVNFHKAIHAVET